MNRRELLKSGLLAGIGGILTGSAPAYLNSKTSNGKYKNIIFYAYDGLTWEDIGTTRIYKRRHSEEPVHFERLMKEGVSGSMDSSALTSIVTDSAAATTAWATGRKIVSGALSMYPDDRKLDTILHLAKNKGMATGVISTTRVTHATPAGWYAQIDWRREEETIAGQLLDFAPDVIIGGGNSRFDPSLRSDGEDYYAKFADAGYTVIKDADRLEANNADKVMGIFSDGHIPYAIDRKFQGVEGPTLKEMTRAGLEALEGSDQGFVVQIEAGRVDHANHANDPGGALYELLEADETLGYLLDFVDQNPDTLLLMASDHGTGSGAVYGVGERYRASSRMFDKINRHRASFDFMLDQMDENTSVSEIREIVENGTGYRMKTEQGELMSKALAGEFVMPDAQSHARQPRNTLAHCLIAGTYDEPETLNMGYVSGQHLAGPVPAALYGNHHKSGTLGMIDNTDLYYFMTEALGIDHKNPEMKAEDAMQYFEH